MDIISSEISTQSAVPLVDPTTVAENITGPLELDSQYQAMEDDECNALDVSSHVTHLSSVYCIGLPAGAPISALICVSYTNTKNLARSYMYDFPDVEPIFRPLRIGPRKHIPPLICNHSYSPISKLRGIVRVPKHPNFDAT